jgi:hypothetical protein
VQGRVPADFDRPSVGECLGRACLVETAPAVRPALFAKRALAYAAGYADACGSTPVTPEHLLAGVLQDMIVPADAGLGRRGRRHLAQLGWTLGPVHLARSMLDAHGIDPVRLHAALVSGRFG